LSGDPFELTFTTASIDFSLPQILATQPVDQDTGVFIGDLIRIELNKPLHQQTLTDNNVFLQGPNQRKIKTNLQTTVTPSGRCFLYLMPRESLSPRTRYTISLQNALADSNGMSLEQDFLFRFTTQKAQLDFSMIDDFRHGLDNWQDPTQSPKSVDFDLASTRWDSIAAGLRDSVMAARLEYHLFAGGLLDFVLTDRPNHFWQLRPGDVVGTYLYGDSSLCRFRFYFDDQLNSLYAAPWLTIDWYGWQKISFRFDYDSLALMK